MKIKVSNQQIEITEIMPLVSDTENVYEAEYAFDDEWEGYQKTAVFEGCGASYQVVLTNTNKCMVPNEIIAESGYVRFGVLGTKTEGTTTLRYPTVWSEKVWVEVASSASGTPAPPTPEVYAQILANEAALDDRVTAAESDIDDLESGKVDKVEGMGLSHNDYSDSEKEKVADAYSKRHEHSNKSVLDAISSALVGAWNSCVAWITNNGANILAHLNNASVHVNATEKAAWNAKQNHLTAGENITIVGDVISATGGQGGTGDFEQLSNRPKYNGSVMDHNTNIPSVPTKTSDITNDSGFITKAVNDLINYYLKSDLYTKAEVDEKVAGKVVFAVVSVLPTASASTMNKIYLVPSASASASNVKDEYITIDNSAGAATRYTWELIGSTAADFSNYYTKGQVDNLIIVATTDMATKTWVAAQGYLTQHQSLVGYATEAWVTAKNYITKAVNDLTNYYTKSSVDGLFSAHNSANDAHSALFGGKVDKVVGKGLSTNDYDDSEKQKVTNANADRHTHSNKALIDTYTQTESNIADAVSKKHSHSNIAVLNAITSALTDAWSAASTWISTNGQNVLNHIADTAVHVTAQNKSAWNGKSTVSGTNDGTNWQSITIDGITKNIPAGGGGGASIKVTTVELPAASWAKDVLLKVSNGSAAVNVATFIAALVNLGTYIFVYDGDNAYWTYGGEQVNLAAYGIAYSGTPADGDTIIAEELYSQSITITGSTANTKVDFQPDAITAAIVNLVGCFELYAGNDNGTIKAYAAGGKPISDMSIQATHYEVTT